MQNLVQCVPLTTFVHGSYRALKDRLIMLPAGLAGDLERAGLVRITLGDTAPKLGKSQDDGAGQPSSALPVAPVSTTTIYPSSEPGRRGRRTTER